MANHSIMLGCWPTWECKDTSIAICFADIRPCLTAYALCINLTANTGVVSWGGIAFFILRPASAIDFPGRYFAYDA